MKLYILRWNPNISSWTYSSQANVIKTILNNKFQFMNWSIFDYNAVEFGDCWIMLQVGTNCDGIVGLGTFCSKPYTDVSWRRKDNSLIYYADMNVDMMIDRRKSDILNATALNEMFDEIDWHGGHSGVLVDGEVAERLMMTIVETLILLKKPNKTIAFRPKKPSPLVPNLAYYLNGLCPTFRQKIIDNKPLVHKIFPEGTKVSPSFIHLDIDFKRASTLTECSAQDLFDCVISIV